MKRLWNLLIIKPEWLMWVQIESYEVNMLENRVLKINRYIYE